MRILFATTVAAAVLGSVALTGCSSTASSSGAGGATSAVAGGAATGASASAAGGTAAGGSSVGTAASSGSGGATFSGDFSGTMSARLCTGGIASLKVLVNGDSETYNGSVSATQIGFVGPEAADYTLAAGNAKPVVSSDGNSFTVTGEKLIDLVSKKSVTLTGTVTCP